MIISIALQKGGVGKSTTSQALASTLGFKKYKVLLIDMDSQGNVSYSSGINENPKNTIVGVFSEKCSITDTIIKCKYYDIIPADKRYLPNIEMSEDVEPTLLINALEPIKNKYDFIIIDTPPALGNISFNSLVASDYVVVPCEPRPFALQGLSALNTTINKAKSINKKLKVAGILLIKYSNRTVLNRQIKDMVEEYADQMQTKVFTTTIRDGIAVAEAQIMQQPLIDYAKDSKSNIDYKAFVTELLKELKK